MNYLIAFAHKPLPGFLNNLVQVAQDEGVLITAGKVCPGPGCYNLAIRLASENEDFAIKLTMALQPARMGSFNPAELMDGVFIEEIL